MKDEKELISTKVLTITVKEYADGEYIIEKLNDGFSVLELVGIAKSVMIDQEIMIIKSKTSEK